MRHADLFGMAHSVVRASGRIRVIFRADSIPPNATTMNPPKLTLPTLERGLFYLLLAANLIPLWSVHYFVTGDGPCHLYNAKVLLDFYHGGELKDFYNPWMFVNTHFEPNWFGHAFMELLLGWGAPAYLAEKFLQLFTCCLLAWACGS